MKKILIILTLLAVSAMLVTSCAKNNPVAPNVQPAQGKLMFALDAADNITSGTVTITKGSITHTLPITITNHTGSVAFEGIQVGTWGITVQLFDAEGVEIYSGSGEAVVTKNQTTTVTIQVEHNTGNLVIIVEVPGPTPTPTPVPEIFQISYSYQGSGGHTGLKRMNTDGTDIFVLVRWQYQDWLHGATNFRGGNILVYTRHGTGGYFIRGVSLKGAPQGYINRKGSHPRWSWDGTKIAYNDGENVRVMDPTGSNEVILTETGYFGCWTPDNLIIHTQGREIYTIEPDGTNNQYISTLPEDALIKDCASDYLLLCTAMNNIYTMNLNGTSWTYVASGSVGNFSADGRYFIRYDGRTYNAEIMDRDGNNIQSIPGGRVIGPCFIY